MSDESNIFARRRDLVQQAMERRKAATYKAFGLDAEGNPAQGMYGHHRATPAEAADYWKSVVNDPMLNPVVKVQRFLALPEETQAEIRKGWGSGDGVHS